MGCMANHATDESPLDMQEQYYRRYVHQLQDKTYGEAQELLNQEADRLESLKVELDDARKSVLKGENSTVDVIWMSSLIKEMEVQEAFHRVQQEFEDLSYQNSLWNRTDADALSLAYSGGLNWLTAQDEWAIEEDHITSIGLIVALIGSFSSVFVSEKESNMTPILFTTARGRWPVVPYKLLLAGIFATLFFMISQVPQWMVASRVFTLPPMDTEVVSFPLFRQLPPGLPMWGYLGLIYLTKYGE